MSNNVSSSSINFGFDAIVYINMKLLHGLEWWEWDEKIKDDALTMESCGLWGTRFHPFLCILWTTKGWLHVMFWGLWPWVEFFEVICIEFRPPAVVQLHYEEYTQVIAQEVINHDTFLCHHCKSRNLWVISFWHIDCDELCFCTNIYKLLEWLKVFHRTSLLKTW